MSWPGNALKVCKNWVETVEQDREIIDAVPFIRLDELPGTRLESARCNFLRELRKYPTYPVAFIVATRLRERASERAYERTNCAPRRKSKFLLPFLDITLYDSCYPTRISHLSLCNATFARSPLN